MTHITRTFASSIPRLRTRIIVARIRSPIPGLVHVSVVTPARQQLLLLSAGACRIACLCSTILSRLILGSRCPVTRTNGAPDHVGIDFLNCFPPVAWNIHSTTRPRSHGNSIAEAHRLVCFDKFPGPRMSSSEIHRSQLQWPLLLSYLRYTGMRDIATSGGVPFCALQQKSRLRVIFLRISRMKNLRFMNLNGERFLFDFSSISKYIL